VCYEAAIQKTTEFKHGVTFDMHKLSEKKTTISKNEMSYDVISCDVISIPPKDFVCCFFLRTLRRGHHWSCSQRKPLPAASRPCQVEDLALLPWSLCRCSSAKMAGCVFAFLDVVE